MMCHINACNHILPRLGQASLKDEDSNMSCFAKDTIVAMQTRRKNPKAKPWEATGLHILINLQKNLTLLTPSDALYLLYIDRY